MEIDRDRLGTPPESESSGPERQREAKAYARIRRRLMLAELVLGAAYLLAWMLAGWSTRLANGLRGPDARGWLTFGPHWTVQLLLFALGLALPWFLLTLPLRFFSEYRLPHRFGLSNQTLRGWVSDLLKAGLLSAALGIPLLLGLYAFLRAAGESWWLWAGLAYSLFGVVLTSLAPILLMPIFYKLRPLGDEHRELEQRLRALAARAGTQVRGVFTFDMSRRTKAANAALAGLGRTRRILLGDTLLAEFSPDEIETIMAHELAHHVHGDIPVGILLQSGLNLLSFYLASLGLAWLTRTYRWSSPSDPAALPGLFICLALIGLLSMPAINAYSRWRESRADEYALILTRKPEAFARAMVRLADQNLAEADPPAWVVWLLHGHPPLKARIEKARRYGERPVGAF